jgi:hypothetical protein
MGRPLQRVMFLHGFANRPGSKVIEKWRAELVAGLAIRSETTVVIDEPAGMVELESNQLAWWEGDLLEPHWDALATFLNPTATFLNPTAPPGDHDIAVGFSQGASALLAWLLHPSYRGHVRHAIVIAPFLPEMVADLLHGQVANQATHASDFSTANRQFPNTPFANLHFIVLGDDDVVDEMHSRLARKLLLALGYTVTWHAIENAPHELNDNVLELATTIISTLIIDSEIHP